MLPHSLSCLIYLGNHMATEIKYTGSDWGFLFLMLVNLNQQQGGAEGGVGIRPLTDTGFWLGTPQLGGICLSWKTTASCIYALYF